MGLVPWLASHLEQVRELRIHRTIADGLLNLPLQILPVEPDVLRAGAAAISVHGLLTSDAIILALMQKHRIEHLVTNDADFLRVPGLRVWMPR